MNYKNELHDLFLMQQVYGTLFSLINKLQITGDMYFDHLTSRQFMAIVAILHLPEETATMNHIARKLGTSRQNANRMLASLEKAGFVAIVPSSKDKRASNVSLTEKGREAVIQCSSRAMDLMADIFQGFDTSELELFWTLLKKLYAFDGVKQDGFEDAGIPLTTDDALEKEMIKSFVDKRNNHNHRK